MIEFPTKLNALHPFSHNLAEEVDPLGEAQYIADLTAGCVLEITPLIAGILSLCESKSNPEIRETLRSRFSDAEIGSLGVRGFCFRARPIARIRISPSQTPFLWLPAFSTPLGGSRS
ncbi:MAG: hypothetical protein OXI86_14870 [Candidatus Poribacteria bacterium]|nr:hypothetical protein [Candidatus Poribacteria bacterium]